MLARKILVLLLLTLTSFAFAAPTLNPDHPDRYTVVKGDTLWDIAGRFLKSPWRWPDVWHVNPQVKNPHLIYPGDELVLSYDANGNPIIRIGKRARPNLKLSPSMRKTRLDRAIPTIPLDAIQQFLSKPLAVGEKELENAPYVVQVAEEHVVAGAGDRLYVRNLKEEGKAKYSVFRPGIKYVKHTLKEDEEPEVLGYEAVYVGETTVAQFGDPATLLLTSTEREAHTGDRLLPLGDDDISENFMPHAPNADIEASIISVVDGVVQIGQNQLVVVDAGSREKIDIGTVLAVYSRGETITDNVSPERGDTVKLPDERAGTLLIFRVFEKVSFALVMDATRPLHVFDAVRNPPEL